jgi:predicted GNAT family acetyltransferase
MNTITITTIDGLDPRESTAIAHRLCRPGSDFQSEVVRVAAGKASSSTPIALWHHDGSLVGWAASHVWQGSQTLEMFTDERHRGRGIASALSAALVAAGVLERGRILQVFSESTEMIARRLCFAEVHRYRREGSDWVAA